MEENKNIVKKKISVGLLPKLIISIALGILMGSFFPTGWNRAVVTGSSLYMQFLKFFIPLMILAYVTVGIADLGNGAGKLLGITCLLAYSSSLISGLSSFAISKNLFPKIVDLSSVLDQSEAKSALESYFNISLPPLFDTLSAVVFAFLIGLSFTYLRKQGMGDALYKGVKELSLVVDWTLKTIVLPLLPLYICGTFVNMTYTGQTFSILTAVWPIYVCIIVMHLVYLVITYVIAGAIGKTNPFRMLLNQIPAYTTALGTQSSVATIPVNLQSAEKNGVSEKVRRFVIPLCANIHMAGDMITVSALVTAVMMLYNQQLTTTSMIGFVAMLGIATIASPGIPGGTIVTALPFMISLGIAADSPMASLLVVLFIAQDSFGTACNVSGDNAISMIINRIYSKEEEVEYEHQMES